MIILADTWIMNWNFANMTMVTKSGKSTKHVLRRGQWPPRQVSPQLLFTLTLDLHIIGLPMDGIVVRCPWNGIEHPSWSDATGGNWNWEENCKLWISLYKILREFIHSKKNSGNHQHRENYKRLDIRDDCSILQRAVVRLLASGSRVT